MLRFLDEGAEGLTLATDHQIKRMVALQGRNIGNYLVQPFFAFQEKEKSRTHDHDQLADLYNATQVTDLNNATINMTSTTCPLEPLYGSNAN